MNYLRVGTAYEAAQANRWETALANETSTTSTRTSSGIHCVNGRTLSLVVVTANLTGTTASYTPSLEATYDGSTWFSFWTASAAITAAETNLYVFGPGCAGAGDEVENIEVPIYRDVRVVLTAASADASNNLDTEAHVHVGV